MNDVGVSGNVKLTFYLAKEADDTDRKYLNVNNLAYQGKMYSSSTVDLIDTVYPMKVTATATVPSLNTVGTNYKLFVKVVPTIVDTTFVRRI